MGDGEETDATGLLSHVAEVGVPEAELFLLLLGEALEPVIALAGSAKPVLPEAVDDAKDREQDDDDLADEVDGVADGEVRAVGRDICPSVGGVRNISRQQTGALPFSGSLLFCEGSGYSR